MSKGIIAFAALLAFSAALLAQNPDCLGLKNPTSFLMTGGNAQSSWAGYIGTKNQQQSTCTSIGSSFSTPVAAASLLSTVDGSSESCGGSNSYDINGQSDYLQRFSIKGSGTDALTNNNLSYLPPDPSYTSSIRIGSYCANGKAEQLIYSFTVNNENQLVTLWYAMSLYDARHDTYAENPEFVIIVEKNNGTTDSPNWQLAASDTLCYIRASPLSGASISPFSQGTSTNVYLQWNKVIINLSKLLYKQVRIKIAAGDCCYNAHYGYCYIAGDCQPMRLNANGCAAGETDVVAGIKAPEGAISYAWYRSKTGKLTGVARTTLSNYTEIPGATTDSLSVLINHFITPTGDTITEENTFMCRMTTKMNETLPIVSELYADVGNKKPSFAVDSLLACDASITLQDISHTLFVTKDSDNVDTSVTQWKFYNSPQPTPTTLVGTRTGGRVNFQYPVAGDYCARVRTSAYDTSCWNEKTVTFRTVLAPRPRVRLQRNNLCAGDTITLFDETSGSTFRQWVIHRPQGDTTLTPATPAIRFRFDTTTVITLRSRNNVSFMADTNGDGYVEPVYCYAEYDTTIFVQDYPILTVTGDTIVCNGTQSIVNVTSQIENTRYDWYLSTTSNNPLQSNSATLTTTPSRDMRYYVNATTPFGCKAWDSINIYIVDPVLTVPVTEVCDNTPVHLYASNAYSFSWTSMPDDPSLSGQQTADSITVTPHQTTTYSLVGHGMNNCSTTPLTQTVTVYPFPVPEIEMSPKFIDSEEPTVVFRDVSEGATTSLWDFGNGNTSTERQIRYTFTDLSEDSIQISLTTGNDLNCTSDTSFYIPIEIFSVWFPNVFTPTLTTNRTFKVFTGNRLEYYCLYIYNRAGQLVFSSYDQDEEWDGTYKGKPCAQGVYVYTCTFRRPGTTDIVNKNGTVTLLQ